MQRSLILAVFLFLLKGFCSEVVTDGDAVVVDDIEDVCFFKYFLKIISKMK